VAKTRGERERDEYGGSRPQLYGKEARKDYSTAKYI
jgi:hypothetical protein